MTPLPRREDTEQEEAALKKKKRKKDKHSDQGVRREPLDDIALARIVVEEEAERKKKKKRKTMKESKEGEDDEAGEARDEADAGVALAGQQLLENGHYIGNVETVWTCD